MLNWPCSPKEGVQQIKPNHINTMNEELKNDEVIILDETYIQKNLGLRRNINYSDMGAAGQEAYIG